MDETPKNEKQLDFDVVAGLSLTDPSKPLRLYWNRERALEQNKRIRLLAPFLPLALLIVLCSITFYFASIVSSEFAAFLSKMHTLLFLISIPVIIVTAIIVDSAMRKEIHQSVLPILEMDSEGLSIRCPQRNFDKIPWSYIREVKTFSWLNWRSIRIVPHDRNSLRQFAVEDKSMLTALIKGLFKLAEILTFGRMKNKMDSIIFTPEYIDVADAWLALDADQVVEAINLRLYHNRRIENGI